jgi:Domain of unknown function (DUF4136)
MYTRTIGALAVATLVAGGAYAQSVNTDSDPSAPFSTYKTYAWTAGTASPISLGEQRIHAAVEGQMAAKGFKLATDETPDVYIATHVLTHEEPQVIANGFGPWGLGGYGAIDVRTLVQGTLIVDMYDAKTKKMVWRGVATGTASDKASKNTAKIDKALEKMFRRYPPSSN